VFHLHIYFGDIAADCVQNIGTCRHCVVVLTMNYRCYCSHFNSATALRVCTKGQCAVIRFLRTELVQGAEICRMLSERYGNSVFWSVLCTNG